MGTCCPPEKLTNVDPDKVPDFRYIIDGDGQLREIENHENDTFREQYADSQVSSSWMSCAYRFFQDKPQKDDDVIVVDSGFSSSEDTSAGPVGASALASSCGSPKHARINGSSMRTTPISSCEKARVKSRSPRKQKKASAVSQ